VIPASELVYNLIRSIGHFLLDLQLVADPQKKSTEMIVVYYRFRFPNRDSAHTPVTANSFTFED